jgi:SAM-dependent methyltransferase
MCNYYWLEHRRYVENGRMRWHAEPAEENFWFDYWREQVNSAYYQRAEKFDLATDELGSVLLAEIGRDGRHLEAGCGAGFWVAALRHAGFDVFGIEYARELVELVNDVYPQLPVQYGDALAIACPDNSIRSYLSFGVVEHRLEGPDPFLREAFRVVEPGGKIVITVPHLGPIRRIKHRLRRYDSAPPAEPFFQYGFTASEFSALLLSAGFEVDYTRPISAHRLLQEESAPYRWLSVRRGRDLWRRLSRSLLGGQDGHMLLCVGRKPVPAGGY